MENTYPVCKSADLIQYYKDEIGLEMTMDQFTNPTSEAWFNNYLHIVSRVFRLQTGELQEKLRSMPPTVENSYLYESALMNIQFAPLIRDLLGNIGCKTLTDFNLLDLKKPTKKSIIHTLSPILNFLRFQESQKEAIEKILVNERAERDMNEMLSEKVRVLGHQSEEQKVRTKEIEKNVKERQGKALDLKEILKAKKLRLEKLKESHLKIEDEKKELMALLERKTNQRDELRNRSKSALSRIVQSPMRLQHDIQLQKDKQPELQKQYDDLKKEYWQNKEHVIEMTEARDAVVWMNEKRKEIEKTLLELKEKKELLCKRRAEMEGGSSQLDNLGRQTEQVESEVMKKREELYKADKAHKDKLTKIASQLNQLKLEDVRTKEAIEKKKKEINSIAERIGELRKRMKAEQELGKAAYDKVVKSLMDYQEFATKEIFNKTHEDVEKEVDKWIAEN